MISFSCACGEPLAAAPEHAGMRVRCPKCHAVLVVPTADSEFDYADDLSPPPPKKKPVLVEDDEDEPKPAKKKAKLVDEDEDRKPRKKKKKKRNYGDDDEPEHVKRLMAKANAELDEEEARHRREGGGIAITPGIILGVSMFVIGIALFVILLLVGFCSIWPLVFAGVGLVRAVLSFLGQGVD